MIISFEWLREYVDVDDVRALAERLTMAGLEVEAVRNPYAALTGARVARIAAVDPHPAGKGLLVCTLDAGAERPVVVCGAPNVANGLLMAWLPPGAVTATGRTVAEAAIHGVTSRGMLASGEDLGLEEKSTGIYVIPSGAATGATLADSLGLGAEVLDVNVTPNRPDCLSHLGIAREAAAVFGKALRRPDAAVTEADEPAAAAVTVDVRDTAGCPRYLARVVRGIKVGPSPDWVARRLTAAGMRPINNVVDATNYVLLEIGHPMHPFDARRVRDRAITVRRATDGETIVTIDAVTRTLCAQDLVIADTGGPVAIAGVMGGELSGIADDTTEVILECACFEPRGIRRTSARLGLASESSFRFERGVDPGGIEFAVDRCAALIAQTSGGRVLNGRVASGLPPPARKTVALRPARLALVAGAPIGAGDAARILDALEIEKTGGADGAISFAIPTFRVDLSLEEDLIEEVVRIWGYDRVPPTIPASREFHAHGRTRPDPIAAIRAAMTSAGFQEVINYSFEAPGAARALGITAPQLPIRNPLSEDQSVMRTSLVPGLVANARHNWRRQQRAMRLFEAGRTFHPEGKTLPREDGRLAGLITGRRHERTWAHPDAAADFYDIKGAVETVLGRLRVRDAAFVRDGLPAHLHPGRGAVITVGGAPAGAVGQLHPKMAAAHDLPEEVFVFEIDTGVIDRAAAADVAYTPAADFPAVERDMALVVDARAAAGDLLATVHALRIPEVEDAIIFDVYAGPQVGAGRKNVAIGITYRAKDRTLTDAEVDAIHGRIVAALNTRFSAALRG